MTIPRACMAGKCVLFRISNVIGCFFLMVKVCQIQRFDLKIQLSGYSETPDLIILGSYKATTACHGVPKVTSTTTFVPPRAYLFGFLQVTDSSGQASIGSNLQIQIPSAETPTWTHQNEQPPYIPA